ncbi:MAG: glycine zipper 2TM domain-containing protein [Alphaproteobacteria bacterium]|nr:glycine zipper 2TM domain-containing protein [Alphaproteobacteria bacterium]
MSHSTRSLIALAATASLLVACTQPNGAPNSGVMNGGGLNKQDVGTGLGAVGGALLGSQIGRGHGQIVGAVGGALLGGLLGNQIGKSLDNADMAAYNATSQRALETAQPGQAMPWQTQHASGVVIPSNYYQNANGQYCREYTQRISVGGQTQEGYGTACRQPDGSWQLAK